MKTKIELKRVIDKTAPTGLVTLSKSMQAKRTFERASLLLDNRGHHRGRRVGIPGGVGVLLVLELDRGVAELEVADLWGRGSFWHQGDCNRTNSENT